MTTSETDIFNTSGTAVPLSDAEIRHIVESVFNNEDADFGFTEVIFTDEPTIVEINKEHLNRDYITDIITFSYHENDEPVEGSLFCCAQRILEQASEFNSDPKVECARVVIHGLLHLCGYADDTAESKERMTNRENFHLTLLKYL